MPEEAKVEEKQFKPLKSVEDAQGWLEKTINDTSENVTSIAQSNARTATVKAFVGLHTLAMNYAKLALRGVRIKEMEQLIGLDLEAPKEETKA